MTNNVSPGEYISFEIEGSKHSGLVLPSTDKTIFIKLENGYNVGFDLSKMKNIKVTEKVSIRSSAPELKANKSLPKITLISTGGTIASRVDYKTGAVHPLSKPEELLAQIPEISKLVDVKILSPFSMLSEDMTPKDWQKLAKLTAKELNNKDVKGVILTHGTDTLHFTAAALSFMLGKLNKPVALVGGQRSSDRGSFDGAQNLICAVHYCLSDIAEVAVVMHGTTNDDYCLAIKGTNVRKMHTSARDAFKSINEEPLAKIWPDGRIEARECNKRSSSNVKALTNFESKVALLKFTPGMDSNVLDFYIKNKYKGIILEGTGLGHVAVSWLPMIKKLVKAKIFVGMTSQCLYGKVNPYVYSTGRLLEQAGVKYLDMLPEVAYVKLGWALGNNKNMEK